MAPAPVPRRDATTEHRRRLASLYPERTGSTQGSARTGGIEMPSIIRVRRRVLALLAGTLLVAFSAAPALACGGLIGPNGAVNLLRTTTFAGYHDGEEHYVTAFEFAGGGGAFGSLTPLPGIPTSVEKGGDWTLQRLRQETEPVQEVVPRAARRRRSRRRRRGPHGGHHRRARPDGPARWRRRGRPMGDRARVPPPARRPRGARVLRGPLRRSSWPRRSTAMPPPSVASRSGTGPPSTSRSRPTTRGSRCASSGWARPARRSSRPTCTC